MPTRHIYCKRNNSINHGANTIYTNWIPKMGKVIPNACQCKTRPKEGKHEAPWIERLNYGDPLLVCKGIAETKGLRCSGSRNWLSAILPTRNEAWLNGTHPGFLIAFAGSNSDTKPNDRLPIIECTHEPSCSKKCVKKNHTKQTKKLIRLSQRIQSVTNGYFGGYIGKRQPGGKADETQRTSETLLMPLTQAACTATVVL